MRFGVTLGRPDLERKLSDERCMYIGVRFNEVPLCILSHGVFSPGIDYTRVNSLLLLLILCISAASANAANVSVQLCTVTCLLIW